MSAVGRFQPGYTIGGKYRIDKILGTGGMGIVVKATHVQLLQPVALKFLLASDAKHPDAGARFLREARAAVRLSSEHVCRVLDVGMAESGDPYMVMEYLDGADLDDVMRERRIALSDAVSYIIQACEALSEAH